MHNYLRSPFEAIEVEGEKNPVVRCHEIIAEGEDYSYPHKISAETSLQADVR